MPTFTASITSGSSDGIQVPGNSPFVTGTLLRADAGRYIFLHFLNVTIPQAANITNAAIDVNVYDAATDDADVDIYAADEDDAVAVTNLATGPQSRTPTTAVVAWDASSLGTGIKTTPNISSVIQEIVDRPGWASGNDILIIMVDGGTNTLRFDSYETSSGTPAQITIEYTEGGSSIIPAVMYYMQQHNA